MKAFKRDSIISSGSVQRPAQTCTHCAFCKCCPCALPKLSSGLFLDPCPSTSQVFSGQPSQLTSKPVVILVNGGTASAAEVFSGALKGNHRCPTPPCTPGASRADISMLLHVISQAFPPDVCILSSACLMSSRAQCQDWALAEAGHCQGLICCGTVAGRATVVGTKTFGKGVVQFYFPMDDEGSGLKVTVEKYLGPDGYDISRRGGIEPDLVCNGYPHGGLASASDDRCIAAALRLIQSAA